MVHAVGQQQLLPTTRRAYSALKHVTLTLQENGKCQEPIQYDRAFFATTTFSVKVQPTDYHGRFASSVTFWRPVSTETPGPVPGEPQGTDERQRVAIGVGVTLAILLVILWTIFFFCYRHKLFHRREVRRGALALTDQTRRWH